MKRIRFRLIFLIVLLVAAFVYRFPVRIQKFAIEARESLPAAVQKIKTSIDTGSKKRKIVAVKLKNKGRLAGIIREKTDDEIMLDVGFGTMGILKSDIEKIGPPSDEERDELMRHWEAKDPSFKRAPERDVTKIDYLDADRITVNVVINDKVRTALLLDTGAPYVTVTPEVGAKLLGDNKAISKSVTMNWVDGSATKGRKVLLESVMVGNAKAKNVEAVICEMPILISGTDGLLGMSFLNNFRVRMDTTRREIVLEEK
ncbi:retropepsin-like aspartic protease [Candidatus Omnitrophota bacterium]